MTRPPTTFGPLNAGHRPHQRPKPLINPTTKTHSTAQTATPPPKHTMERLFALLPPALQPPRLPDTGGVDYRLLAQQLLAVVLAVARHPLVFWPAVVLTSAWLVIEVAFYFYLRYIVLPELNRLTRPMDSVHTSWDQFHKIIDLVAHLKGVRGRYWRWVVWWGRRWLIMIDPQQHPSV